MSSARRAQLAGALMIAVAAVAFSGKAVIVKLAYRHGVDAVTLLALRMLYAGPLFLALAWWASRQAGAMRLATPDKWKIVGVGLLGYYLASLFDFLGLQYITAALERLVLFLYPTFVVLYAAVFAGYRIRPRDVLALAVSYTGIALVFVNDLATQQTNVVLGAFFVMLSALCYTGYLVGSEHLLRRVGSVRFACLASLVATVGVLLHFVLTRDVDILAAQPAPVHGWAMLMAAVSTVLPIVLTSAGIHRLGSGNAAMISTLGPAATIFLGYAFLAEPITPVQLAGAALVIAGVLVVALRRDKQRTVQEKLVSD